MIFEYGKKIRVQRVRVQISGFSRYVETCNFLSRNVMFTRFDKIVVLSYFCVVFSSIFILSQKSNKSYGRTQQISRGGGFKKNLISHSGANPDSFGGEE